MTWTHDSLAADLLDARHMVGEIAVERLMPGAGYQFRGPGQIDVVAMKLSWTNPRPRAYEVKISRADFLSDVRSEKWRRYLGAVGQVYFAVPRGLVAPGEVPDGAGLICRSDRCWHAVVAAPIHPLDPVRFHRLVVALLFRHYPAPWRPESRGVVTLHDGTRLVAGVEVPLPSVEQRLT